MKTGHYEYGVADLTKPRQFNGTPFLRVHRIKVEIIDEGITRTKVRFLERHADGRGPGTITTVKNKNVKYTQQDVADINNPAPGSYRLPYKDD